MNDKEKIDFYERWIKAMDEMDIHMRGRVNAVSIVLTGLFISIGSDGVVEIDKTENKRWKK